MNAVQKIGQLLISIGKALRGTVEQSSPGNWVRLESSGDNAKFREWISSNLIIPIEDPILYFTPVADTNSMDPVIDADNGAVLLWSSSPQGRKAILDRLQVGDVAVYQSPKYAIIHRIIKIGSDKQGRYFRFAGDNNGIADTWIVRDENILAVSIGVIY